MLGEKIINDKINDKIAWINSSGIRNYDPKLDLISVSLTPRQFTVVKRDYKLGDRYVLCTGRVIDNFDFNDYNIRVHFNDRLDIYELTIKHRDYLEGDERDEYLDELFKEI